MKKILILVLLCTASIYCSQKLFDKYREKLILDGFSKEMMLHSLIKSSGSEPTEWLKDFLNDQEGCLKKTDLEQVGCCDEHKKPLLTASCFCKHKTPLCAAALLGQVDTVKILLETRFGPNLESKVNSNSGFRSYNPVFRIFTTAPFLPALARAHIDESRKLEIFKILFKHHANPNLKDETGRSALMVLLALYKTDEEAQQSPIGKLLWSKSECTQEDYNKVLNDRDLLLKEEEALRIKRKREAEELDKEILADTKRICLNQELESIGVKKNRLDW